MNLITTARAIYQAAKNNESLSSRIRCEYNELAEKIALDPNAGVHVTSATVNGQSFSKTTTMTNNDRLIMLSQVVAMLKIGAATSSRVTPIF